jgi:gamma-glutamyltranspeptidase/glutathione hydrolase/leukotriene-C4 hydrolase
VDAAIAMLLCQGVSDPHRSGLGGGLFMLVYQRSTRTALALDAREVAPAKVSGDLFEDNATRADRGMQRVVQRELCMLKRKVVPELN